MKSFKLLSMVLAVLLFAPVAWAQMGMDEESMMPMMMHEGAGKGDAGKGMAKKLELTPEQEQKIEALRAEQKEAMKPLKERLAAQKKELKGLVDKKAGDRDLEKLLDRIKDTRDDMQDVMTKYRKKHDAVLTPTQRAKLALGMGKPMKEKSMEKPKEKSKKKTTKKS